MASRKVLVTGGAGFIGSHVAEAYLARGDRVWVLDDLSSGREQNLPATAEFIHASVNDDSVRRLFETVGGFDIVNHHAAQLDVRKSVADPRTDARINLDGLLNLLEAARATGIGRFVFVSSGGVIYGEPEQRPTPENAPTHPLSPYGVSKLASEYYLHYYDRVQGVDYVALRYANVFGPRQDPHGEAGVVAIFSTRLIEAQPLTVYGDGLQTRDYVFVADVVAANLLAGDMKLPAATSLDQRAFNVGTGVETSVLELARTLGAAAGREAEIRYADARPGELRHSCLDAGNLRRRGWQVNHDLEQGLRITFEYSRTREER
ncbi:MAG: NAD-dependent epimerase/dehydratase family protein [Gemmatimonadota bacterium]